jgi:LytS/YehU family sensor histidine kinase
LIKGSDSAWSASGTSSSVSFFRLAAGDYQFQVRSRKANTEWSEPTVFNFSIAPSFWETTLFKVIALLNVVFLIWFGFQSRLRKVRRTAFVQTRLADLEMKALRAQMNPHFIYNALNSIQSLIASGKQKDAMRYVSKFGKLLRLILEHSEEGKTSLQKELDVNSLYIQLEQLRLGFDFAVHINIAEDLIPEEEKVPALIIQPIIENALWHGLTNIKEDKHLIIDVSATDVYLIIGISDNGLGIVATANQNLTSSEKRKSFGSQIVRKRLMTYNNDNSEPLHIRDLKEIGKQGTEVKLFIRRYVY